MAAGGGGGVFMAAGGGGVSVAVGGSGSGYDAGDVWGDLEPFFFDEAEAVADHERRTRREQEEAQKAAQRLQKAIARENANKAVMAKIKDYDPKQGGEYYNRFHFADFSKFDLDEESPVEPMRYTNMIYNKGDEHWKSAAVNILSVKIASLDVTFPIDVYGTVIFRDSIDYKCVYLFHREKDNCQTINSKDESLILTGPKRGLFLLYDVYVEIDLKIKDGQVQEKELSKGFFNIRGIASRYLEKCNVESKKLATRLSTMEVLYAVVNNAEKATIAVEVLRGKYYGKIVACTAGVPDHLVLHDSEVAGVMNKNNSTAKGVIQLLRSVVSVSLEEILLVSIVAQTGNAESERTISFSPHVSGADGDVITLGETKMFVKVAWSLISR